MAVKARRAVSERDPRRDPREGDRVLMGCQEPPPRYRAVVTVERLHRGDVYYLIDGERYACTHEEWRRWMHDCRRVIHPRPSSSGPAPAP